MLVSILIYRTGKKLIVLTRISSFNEGLKRRGGRFKRKKKNEEGRGKVGGAKSDKVVGKESKNRWREKK